MSTHTFYFYATFGQYRIAIEVPAGWNNGRIIQEMVHAFLQATGMILGESYIRGMQVNPMFDSTPAQLGYSHEAPGVWRKIVDMAAPDYWQVGA